MYQLISPSKPSLHKIDYCCIQRFLCELHCTCTIKMLIAIFIRFKATLENNDEAGGWSKNYVEVCRIFRGSQLIKGVEVALLALYIPGRLKFVSGLK